MKHTPRPAARQQLPSPAALAADGGLLQPASCPPSPGPERPPGRAAVARAKATPPDIPRPRTKAASGKPAAPIRLPRLLSVHQAAQSLGLSDKTIRRWIEREELPVHRLGRALRIAENDLAGFPRKSPPVSHAFKSKHVHSSH